MRELKQVRQKQLDLIEVMPQYDFSRPASRRTWYGKITEEIVVAALALTPIPTDGRYRTCFDAQKGKRFYEIKSVKVNSSLVIWKWRFEKEAEYADRLSYLILLHDCSNSRSTDHHWQRMGMHCRLLYEVSYATMVEVFHKATLVKTNTKEGHGSMRGAYAEGYYRVPVRLLRGWLYEERELNFSRYGVKFSLLHRKLM